MIPRSQRLDIVLTLAERDESSAARSVQQVHQQLQHEQQHLVQLQDYSRDYIARINAQQRGLCGRDLMNYRHFLQQLQRAEIKQQNTVLNRQQQLEGLQVEWQHKHHRKEKVAEWIERLRRGEALALDRQEQRMLDELSMRLVATQS